MSRNWFDTPAFIRKPILKNLMVSRPVDLVRGSPSFPARDGSHIFNVQYSGSLPFNLEDGPVVWYRFT